MPAPDQLTTDVDFLTQQPEWQDEGKRRDFIRNIAIGEGTDTTPDERRAVASELWKRADTRSTFGKAVDFTGRAIEEVVKSAPAAGTAAVFAAGDAFGMTDTGSGTRLKRGLADMGGAIAQTSKQIMPGASKQAERDDALAALKEDLDSNTHPPGLESWLAGEYDATDIPDPDTKQWVDALTWGVAKKAVAADYMGQVNPEKVRAHVESDRNPGSTGNEFGLGPRDLLADYVATRDPASWEAFKARVTETEGQAKTRMHRYIAEQDARLVMGGMPEGIGKEMATRGMEMQTSPVDLATAALPFLRGARALQAAKAGGMAASAGRIAMGAGKEALQEGVTEKLQDPRASTGQVLEAAAMGAIGSGALETGMAGIGAAARRFPQAPPAVAGTSGSGPAQPPPGSVPPATGAAPPPQPQAAPPPPRQQASPAPQPAAPPPPPVRPAAQEVPFEDAPPGFGIPPQEVPFEEAPPGLDPQPPTVGQPLSRYGQPLSYPQSVESGMFDAPAIDGDLLADFNLPQQASVTPRALPVPIPAAPASAPVSPEADAGSTPAAGAKLPFTPTIDLRPRYWIDDQGQVRKAKSGSNNDPSGIIKRFHLRRRTTPILFKGDSKAVTEWIKEQGGVMLEPDTQQISRPSASAALQSPPSGESSAPPSMRGQAGMTGPADKAGQPPQMAPGGVANPPGAAPNIETDPARRQEIQNSILEGEGILKSGRSISGKKLSSAQLDGVRRSVESAKAKLGTVAKESKKGQAQRGVKIHERTDGVEFDIVDFVKREGMGRPPHLERDRMGRKTNAHGEHDALRDFYRDMRAYYAKLTRPGGRDVDTLAQQAYEEGMISRPDVDEFIATLRRDLEARRQQGREAGQSDKDQSKEEKAILKEGERQNAAWAKATQPAESKLSVQAEQFSLGDVIEVNGENLTVVDVQLDADGNVDRVTLEDGRKFGRQQMDAGEIVHVDDSTPAPDEFLPPHEREVPVKQSAAPSNPRAAYDSQLEAFREASRKFNSFREAYRARKIGDDEFLAARQEFDAASDLLDQAERTLDAAPAASPPSPSSPETDMFGYAPPPPPEVTPKAPVETTGDLGGILSETESVRPMNNAETKREQDQDPLGAIRGAIRESEAERAQGKMDMEDEELSRERTYREATAWERAQAGDDSAYDDMDAAFRERFPPRQPGAESTAEELQSAQRVWTPGAFARLFDVAFEAKDFDAVLEAVKTSDKAVWVPLLKKFFQEQGDNPVSAAKADWMRHIMAGTRPPDAAPPKAAPPPQPQPAYQPPPPPRWAPPPRSATPPPRGATPPKKPAGPGSVPPATKPPPPRIPVNPQMKGLPKSPFKIIEDFAKSIGKAIHVRKLKPSQLGVYRPGSTMTAVRFAGDLDTAAHELAGHWTDDKYGIGKPWMAANTRSPYDAELATFWIHGSKSNKLKIKRAEGIAEFVRAYVMDPTAAVKQAPTFAQYFEKTIPKEAMAALNKFSDDVRTWAALNPLKRAGMNIRMEPPTLQERVTKALFGDPREFSKSGVDVLRSWFDDSYHYAIKGWKAALGMQGKTPLTVKPSENFDLALRLLSSHDARLEDQMEHGLVPLNPKQAPNAKGELEVQRITDPMTGEAMTRNWLLGAFDHSSKEAQEQDMRDASAMMVAQRTLEKAGIIDQKAQAEINALDPKDPTTPRRRNRILQKAEESKRTLSGLGAGMMTDVEAAREAMADLGRDPNRARRLQEAARRYRAWADTNLDYLRDTGRLSQAQVDGIRAENAQYVDMHRLSEEFDLQSRTERGVGNVGTARDVVKRFKGSSLEIENVYKSLLGQTDAIQKEAIRNRAMRTFTDVLETSRSLYEGDPVELDRIGSRATAKDRNTIAVWKNGQRVDWKLDPDVFEAVKGAGDLGSHAFIDMIAIPQQIARYLITHSPAFMIRNPIRDAVGRSVVSEHGSKPWDILGGYSQAEKSRFEIYGGGMFGNYAKDRLTWNRELKRGMAELRKDPRNILLTPLELKRAWERIAASSETVGRVAEFKRAYQDGIDTHGYSPEEAAIYAAGEARGLMDFAKMGSVMRTINRLVPFSNAHLRGLSRSMQTGIKNPGAFALRWALFVAAPTLAVRAWNRMSDPDTEKEYLQLPAWQRDFFWNIKVGNHWVRIPKPHELGVMAGGVERAIDKGLFGTKHAFDGYAGSATSALMPMSSPVEATGPLKVPIEIMFNRDSFRDKDIIPSWERELRLDLRKGAKHSSNVGQAVGKLIGADPRYIDHFLHSYGGIGQAVTDFTSSEMKLGEAVKKSSGLTTMPPSTQSVDYQWVMDWARRNGQTGRQEIKYLHKMIEPVYNAATAQEADAAAARLRKVASGLRDQFSGRAPVP